MPVIAVAIAALPAVALLLVVVTWMESLVLGDMYEQHRRHVIGDEPLAQPGPAPLPAVTGLRAAS